MTDKTLKEIYEEQKKLPTPANAFIFKLCEVTHRSEMTVRSWLTGKYRPDINTQIVLAHHLKTSVESFFPPLND